VIGWIGTGVMGKSMCGHLLKAGYSLNVFNRTKSKADDLLNSGAKWLEPAELAKSSDVVILMLGFPKDVEDMVLSEHGVLKSMKKGYVICHIQCIVDRPHN
jgi:3-hydroxyisobutyrate dehydrogenase